MAVNIFQASIIPFRYPGRAESTHLVRSMRHYTKTNERAGEQRMISSGFGRLREPPEAQPLYGVLVRVLPSGRRALGSLCVAMADRNSQPCAGTNANARRAAQQHRCRTAGAEEEEKAGYQAIATARATGIWWSSSSRVVAGADKKLLLSALR